ncbi:hypothetical protein B1A_15903, partial [mine drainage metagenome]
TLENNVPYLHITVLHGNNPQEVFKFIYIFQLLLQYYLTKENNIYNNYLSIDPELQNIDQIGLLKNSSSLIGPNNKIGKKKTIGRLGELKAVAPELFVDGYATSCQGDRQPNFTNSSNYNSLLEQGIEVLPFPAKDPKWYFYCDNVNHSHIGLKRNKLEENQKEFPFVPCCYDVVHMTSTN